MTAYEGTRPRARAMRSAGPSRSHAVALPGRRRVSSPARAGGRAQPVRLLLAGVLVGFLLGLIYLATTVQIAGTDYEVDRLVAERDDLLRQVRTLEASIVRWGAEPLVLERAQAMGFDPLGARVRIPAR